MHSCACTWTHAISGAIGIFMYFELVITLLALHPQKIF